MSRSAKRNSRQGLTQNSFCQAENSIFLSYYLLEPPIEISACLELSDVFLKGPETPPLITRAARKLRQAELPNYNSFNIHGIWVEKLPGQYQYQSVVLLLNIDDYRQDRHWYVRTCEVNTAGRSTRSAIILVPLLGSSRYSTLKTPLVVNVSL